MVKRAFDIGASLTGIVLFLPLMVLIALLIRRDSPGPIVFCQRRVGRHERIFRLYKFRTMVADAERRGTSVTTATDARVTPLGRLLRRTKLDELPQLFNVLRGDMSFVGPRPEVPEITALYTPQMKRIFLIRPGITSVATLQFRQEEELLARVQDPDEFYQTALVPLKVALSMQHVSRRSFWFDMSILCKTIWALTPFGRHWPIREHAAVAAFRQTHQID